MSHHKDDNQACDHVTYVPTQIYVDLTSAKGSNQ
jgi:hypothetical protein